MGRRAQLEMTGGNWGRIHEQESDLSSLFAGALGLVSERVSDPSGLADPRSGILHARHSASTTSSGVEPVGARQAQSLGATVSVLLKVALELQKHDLDWSFGLCVQVSTRLRPPSPSSCG